VPESGKTAAARLGVSKASGDDANFGRDAQKSSWLEMASQVTAGFLEIEPVALVA